MQSRQEPRWKDHKDREYWLCRTKIKLWRLSKIMEGVKLDKRPLAPRVNNEWTNTRIFTCEPRRCSEHDYLALSNETGDTKMGKFQAANTSIPPIKALNSKSMRYTLTRTNLDEQLTACGMWVIVRISQPSDQAQRASKHKNKCRVTAAIGSACKST